MRYGAIEFGPVPLHARQYDVSMQNSLAESVLDLTHQAKRHLSADLFQRIGLWATTVSSGRRQRAATFGAYFDLVPALEANDFEQAQRLLLEIVTAPYASAKLRIRRLDEDCTNQQYRRMCRFMGGVKTGASGITAPPPIEATKFADTLRQALNLLLAHHPNLHDELQSLISEIVLVAADDSSRAEFEGGTCFKLWGALFLNATYTPTPLELAITLAHEEGHAYLFGLCQNEMLVENCDRETYWSPIRNAKRPLEGIFHATFVSARMIDLMLTMRRDRKLSMNERQQIEKDLRDASNTFCEGVAVIEKHARLTRTGRDVLESMTHAMSSRTVNA